MKHIKLNNSTKVPILGFGTAKMLGKGCQKAIEKALEVGYRHIDTGQSYNNQKDIAKAIKRSGVKRERLFITSKVFYYDLKPRRVKEICQRCLDELQTNYLDLFLIHWPNKTIPLKDTLNAFDELLEVGVVKSIGVSNFTIKHLRECLKIGIPIVNNQVEFHPSLNQIELKRFCDENGISLTAYSPLGQGHDLKIKTVLNIAKKHSKSPAQIIIKWLISQNIITIPKSEDPFRIKENWESQYLSLTENEIIDMNNLNTGNRIVNPSFEEFDY